MTEITTDQFERKDNKGKLLPADQRRIRNEALANLVREGMTAVEAGRRVGLKRSHAHRIVKLYGVCRKVGRPRLKPEDEALLDGGSHG